MDGMTPAQADQLAQMMNFFGEPIFWVMMVTELVGLIIYIMVLVKVFQHAGVGLGILGIFCSIFTFIWGWLNAKQYGMTPIMLLWSFLIVLSIIQYVLFQTVMVQKFGAVMSVMGNGY